MFTSPLLSGFRWLHVNLFNTEKNVNLHHKLREQNYIIQTNNQDRTRNIRILQQIQNVY